ncbi:MAG: type I-E CRISPR-associated protein Cas5/CasD [Thermaceae bacterium]
MPTLLLRLMGPMQSWGTRSRFDYRDTALEPTKSGVLGLVAAALGRDRKEDISDLAALRMGVRVDKEGVLKYDYQTAREVLRADGKSGGDVQSWRYYLADAAFLVGLEGEDRGLLEGIHRALLNPRWPLFLGRKGYLPSPPVWLKDGLREEPLEEALFTYPPLKGDRSSVRLVIEHRPGQEVFREGLLRPVRDQPAGPFAERRYRDRHVWEVVRNVDGEPNPSLD